jgi:hypothetical protein
MLKTVGILTGKNTERTLGKWLATVWQEIHHRTPARRSLQLEMSAIEKQCITQAFGQTAATATIEAPKLQESSKLSSPSATESKGSSWNLGGKRKQQQTMGTESPSATPKDASREASDNLRLMIFEHLKTDGFVQGDKNSKPPLSHVVGDEHSFRWIELVQGAGYVLI